MMMYGACVPVLQHYLNQLDHMLLKTQRHLATKPEAELLQLRLAPDMMVLWQQILVAIGFSLRASAPLVEVDAPTTQFEEKSIESLRADLQVAQNFLGQLKPEQFINRGHVNIQHQAGDTVLDMPASVYLQHYALPNFFFHLSMVYALLRQYGVPLGKHDFDGFHQYP